jgi:hypothetical protein
LVSSLVVAAGCSVLPNVSRDLPRATKPVKYRMMGANVELRTHLEQGLTQLKGEQYAGAVRALNRALWDLERVDARWLRLEELAEAHEALADAYAGLRRPSWADQHRTLALMLSDRARQRAEDRSPERSLATAKEAYAKAQFRDALVGFRQALVELEDLAPAALRIGRLEEARCYVAFTYLALEEEERAKDELECLADLDASLAFCLREAPRSARGLFSHVLKARSGR